MKQALLFLTAFLSFQTVMAAGMDLGGNGGIHESPLKDGAVNTNYNGGEAQVKAQNASLAAAAAEQKVKDGMLKAVDSQRKNLLNVVGQSKNRKKLLDTIKIFNPVYYAQIKHELSESPLSRLRVDAKYAIEAATITGHPVSEASRLKAAAGIIVKYGLIPVSLMTSINALASDETVPPSKIAVPPRAPVGTGSYFKGQSAAAH